MTQPIPAGAGIGLRFPHLADLEQVRPALALLELHAENLFSLRPAIEHRLVQLRVDYPFSLHGVGMSLGSADGVDELHLQKLADAVRRYEPALVSEHLCWNRINGMSLPDLLPLPMGPEALEVVVANVDRTQSILGRPIAIENISSYLRYEEDEMTEAEFLSALVQRTGCQLLVDINNLHVNRLNLGEPPEAFLDGIPSASVAEFHLAGPTEIGGAWIDTHATPVPDEVWRLYETALAKIGARPTIVEWDQDLPQLEVLVTEAGKAQALISAPARAVA